MTRRILMLSVSAGAGHVRAADALHATVEAMAAQGHDVVAGHLDVMDYVPSSFRRLYADFYLRLITRHPQLWGMLYRITGDAHPDALTQRMRRTMERLNTRALRKAIAAFQPDAIICTHFLPAEMLMHDIRRERFHVPVWVQVTDFDLHRMWVVPRMRGYFAANDEIAARMHAVGIDRRNVYATGIPIMPAFATAPARAQCAGEYGIDPARPAYLVMGGGAGVGNLDEVAARLLAVEGDFQLVVLAGRNADALSKLQKLAVAHPGRLFPQGFSKQVERLMACCDLAITKPGGLTTSECLAMGLPMIVNAPIPGQEERNADYLLEQGAALKAIDAEALAWRIGHLSRNPGHLSSMRERARAIGRPDAAKHVLDVVLADLAAHA
ncbi:processive 1,2-diacylglycerol beta-glucosyltransferase [Luteibacter sp. Sphag1AF]|uniref:MGDG synthase family glycosyltransferase n=1 Tax=Luteibacter sp. Sphag1AF TaxID=2587031 RepID=UPI00160FFEE1|nr:glycosyltransferase [Luteibacter sp. Sphag1AF]MBB3228728.1 processive 1,2-diacylglycerol beta-glucosyltransferase [Luteibacter sp. Sphag1AF]